MSPIQNFQTYRSGLSGIGCSDASAALGLNPWKTRYQFYLECIGEIPRADLSDNEAVKWGVIHEEAVAKVYAEKMGCKVRRNNRQLVHPDHPWFFGHIDREIVGSDAILECKTAHEYLAGHWGDENTSEVPEHYLIQCLGYLCITGKAECHLAVLIGGNKHRIYIIKASDYEKEIRVLPTTLEIFWRRVEERDPPGASDAGDLALMYPEDQTPFIDASDQPGLYRAVDELHDTKAAMKELKGLQEKLEFSVKEAMRDAQRLEYKGEVLATWKSQKSKRVDLTELRKVNAELVRAYTVEKASRVFRLKPRKEI